MIAILLSARFGICPRCACNVLWRHVREKDQHHGTFHEFWRTHHITTSGKSCLFYQASEPSQTVAGSLVEPNEEAGR